MRSGSSAMLDPTSQQCVDHAPCLPFIQVWASAKGARWPALQTLDAARKVRSTKTGPISDLFQQPVRPGCRRASSNQSFTAPALRFAACRRRSLGPLLRLSSKAAKPRDCPTPGCLLYTSDAADEEDSVDLGGRRIIKK